MEKLIDVVDAGDCVVKSAPRQLVHAEKWLHRAVHVFVFNAAGQLFLQKRSSTKASAPNKWVSSCSGHVDAGEDYLQAAQRELGEEIGLQLSCDALQAILNKVPVRLREVNLFGSIPVNRRDLLSWIRRR